MTLNILTGHGKNNNKTFYDFFNNKGKYVVMGGTTLNLISEYLKKDIVSDTNYINPKVPPLSHIEGTDLATEGYYTLKTVLSYLQDKALYDSALNDASKLICDLIYKSKEINFYIGTKEKENIPFTDKKEILNQIFEILKKDKILNIIYF